MLNDRMSTYSAVYGGVREGEGLARALATEFEYGLQSLASRDFQSGPAAFAAGRGRHGTARL